MTELIKFDEECVMTVNGFDFCILSVSNELHNFFLLTYRIPDIRGNAYTKNPCRDASQDFLKLSAPVGYIVQVHGAAEIQVSVRVEAIHKLFALMEQIALNLIPGCDIKGIVKRI